MLAVGEVIHVTCGRRKDRTVSTSGDKQPRAKKRLILSSVLFRVRQFHDKLAAVAVRVDQVTVNNDNVHGEPPRLQASSVADMY